MRPSPEALPADELQMADSGSESAGQSSPFDIDPHLFLSYSDFSGTIHRRPLPPSISSLPDIEIFERIIHPYNTPAFEELLNKHSLTQHYPFLINNLNYGFPLGNLPPLQSTIVIPNHSSVQQNLDVVMAYITTELDARRMSGPFSREETERILQGPFYCSPFIVAIQDQGPDLPLKKRVCRNLSRGDKTSGMGSVNSFISKEDFPTRFDMAARVAEAVSYPFR